MCPWRAIAGAVVVALAGSTTANTVAADSFEQRWLPAPQAQTPTQHWLFLPQLIGPAQALPEQPVVQTEPSEQSNRHSTDGTPRVSRPRKTVFVRRASFYAYRGGKTASGASFKHQDLTAAHRTLPFGTRVRVTDIRTGRSVNVIVTDRGPHSRGRVLDLSLGAAKVLGIESRGVVSVRVQVISG